MVPGGEFDGCFGSVKCVMICVIMAHVPLNPGVEVCFERVLFFREFATRFAGQGGVAGVTDSGIDSVSRTGVGE